MTREVQEILIRCMPEEGWLKLYPFPSKLALNHGHGLSCYHPAPSLNAYRCNRPPKHEGPHIRYSVRASKKILLVWPNDESNV